MLADELHHVLFWREREELDAWSKMLYAKYFPIGRIDTADSARYAAEYNVWMKEKIPTKEAFFTRIEDYARCGEPDQVEIRQSNADLVSALEFSTMACGKKRCAGYAAMAQGWAFHLDDYSNEVHTHEGQMILELGTGAGLGTWAVMSKLPKTSCMLSADFDFAAAQNANGIALALGLEGCAAGILANNWFLPFDKELFDTVCAHYSLDECRELPSTLKEAARVLRPGGRLVLVTRANPYDRQERLFKLFGIPRTQCREILRQVRLNSGPDDLITYAAACGMQLTKRQAYRPKNGHERVLLVFTKDEEP